MKHDENQERREEKMKKTALGAMLALILASALTAAFNFSPVKAIGTGFTIQSDGSVSPPTAPVVNVGNVFYTLTDDIQGSIGIVRGNIVVDGAGYTISGDGEGIGISVSASNVTLRNANVRYFEHGIVVSGSYNTILNNTASYCVYEGIWVDYWASWNILIGNNASNNGPTQGDGILIQGSYNMLAYNIASNNRDGIALANPIGGVHDNIACYNTVSNNYEYGFWLFDARSNRLFGNVILNNADHGVYIEGSAIYGASDNMLYHNSFINNVVQARDEWINNWNDNYPSGGNYWSDYTGIDEKSGPNQDLPGSDGIGDTPYYPPGALFIDMYPLMQPYTPSTHDIGITSIEPSQTVEGSGGSVQIGVRVENHGDLLESFNVTTYAGGTIVGTKTVANLFPTANSLLTFTWNTTGWVKGNYTISAYAWPVLNETDTLDNSRIDGTVLITIPGDVNGDKRVDGRDIAVIAKYFGSTSGYPPNADISDDGKIDGKDIAVAAKNFGQIWSLETMKQSEVKKGETEK